MYLGIIISVTLIITINVLNLFDNFGEALRHAFFMTASTITATGFATVDTSQWPTFSQTLLLFLMFIGACAGSTGGGMKVSRIMIIIKAGIKELKYIINPRAVATVKMDGKPVEKDVVRGATSYLILFIMLMFISILLITFDKYSIEESASAVITCMNNVGYGVGRFSTSGNLGGLNSFSKIVLCFDMLLGRLEIYPVIMLFSIRKR